MTKISALRSACRAIDPTPIAEVALDLLKIPSPPGDETAIAERVAGELRAVGIPARLDEQFSGSPSVIAEFGADEGPILQWHGHLDVIDVPHDPPELAGDVLVGRGAADMKGPVAAMISAAGLLAEHDLPESGRVLITFHGRHESGGNEPLHALIARGIHGDAAITGELGGGRDLPIGGLGLTFWEARIEQPGGALHETVADPHGADALTIGRELLEVLIELRERLASVPAEHPKPSLFVGQFSSGDYFNRVANTATLRGTRRHDVESSLVAVANELRDVVGAVEARSGATIDLSVTSIAEAFAVDSADPLVVALRWANQQVTGHDLRLTRSQVATNAVHFVTEAGIPAVCYGPDHSTNHSDHEMLAVSELARLAGGFALASLGYLEGFDDEGVDD